MLKIVLFYLCLEITEVTFSLLQYNFLFQKHQQELKPEDEITFLTQLETAPM